MRTSSTIAAGVALLSGFAAAHSHETSPQLQARKFDLSKRCSSSVAAMNKKRWAKRNEKSLVERDGNTTVAITTEAPYYDVLQNETCILTEEVTAGPYVWPRSQTLRQDMREGQAGIPMIIDIGVMDVETCEPMDDVLVDIWYCNSTGSYSSFTALSPDTPFEELLEQLNKTIGEGELDLHTDDTTFLRAHWPTNSNGIVEFTGIVPGFYVERTIHMHVQVHTDWAIRSNGTIASSTTVSTGQLFINETLSAQLMALEPYVSHTAINRTTNDIDSIYAGEVANGWDPSFQIVPLDGENVENGVIGYITVGVDTSTQQKMRRDVQKSKI
ncbi:hypothetical protein Daus18300_004729 [Diaporthe australafricana]|uniref:Protocatechuate 3 n=1 Tax=Diaporthe australafricana TaxID=127596 RepID=A0ABR3X6R7_9PEZI